MTKTAHPTTDEPTDLHDMVVVHRVFRRELRALPHLLLGTPPGDLSRAAVVARHARLILAGLHLHHSGEDALLWPLLIERGAPPADVVKRMQAQHEVADELIQQLDVVLVRWQVEARPAVAVEAAGLMDRLAEAVIEHLDDEERTILPMAAEVITPEEWAAVGEASVAKMSRQELPLMFGAVLEDASSEERRAMLQALPLPARLLMQSWGPGHYRRYITKVRASS